MLKATYKDVGLLAFPADTSYCRNIETGFEGGISTTRLVKIMSRPFKMRVISGKKLILREFILVRDIDDSMVVVLNKFGKITNEK